MPNWTNVISSLDWNSLLNGLIGSVVGAAISAIVVLMATRWEVRNTIRLQVEWERERVKQQRVQQQHLLVRSLLGELRDNLEMAPSAHDFYSWAVLSSDAWISARGHVSFLSPDTQDLLRRSYRYVQRYNSKLRDRRAADDFGKGSWDKTIEQDIEQFSGVASPAIDKLNSWLQQHPIAGAQEPDAG